MVMKTLAYLLVLSLALVFRFHLADGFTFPSILDDARQAMMKFSKPATTTTTTPTKPTVPGGGWLGGGRRRRRYVRPRPPSRTKPSNSFLEVLSKVEKSVLEAQASGNKHFLSRAKMDTLINNIKIALKKRSFLFARETLGKALYKALTTRSGPRVKRSASSAKQFLDKLQKEIGQTKFSELLGVEDYKTLVFAIDDTGSMGGEIRAVKDISSAIVRTQAGKKTVNYILSVFNDPTTGPVIFKDSGTEFIKELQKLRAHGGGDYPELTFKGMLDAMEEGPREGSPMYVFTDATAKDHTKDNINTLIGAARDFGVSINFFTTSAASSFAPFVQVARETCGMILRLVGSSEIRKLESITKLSLRNSGVCMTGGDDGGFFGKKRAVSRSKVILVDDSVKNMIISVSTQNSNPVIVLRDPSGRRFTGRKISLYRAAIYELINPTPGRWTLSVAASAGKYHYLVRGSSDSNIDFDYYFVMLPTRKGRYPIPINQPLAGQRANAIITVAGAERIQRNRLSVELIDSRNGRVLTTVAMTPRSSSKVHFVVSFTPPSTPFKFRMKGRTKAGHGFERSSRKTIRATTALIRVYRAKDGQLTIPRGRRMYVILLIFNVGPTETFDVSVNDPKRYATTRRKQRVQVYKNRSRRFILWFTAPSSATPGKGYPVAVTIKGRKSRVETGQILNLIVA
ncbi:von Willebrand factor A domain-containing protein 7-like [Actinia tenebrosa]|uniref:von Willebrand factor A domain-containing protein 7-like n=1 Tax=Actinia tenebrosa TaxID=6105 RepID=A0A6P8J0W6_ACTTE|nr:von Willebrand factor A domain-containing protein 7-like [Actinia tenebrosa]